MNRANQSGGESSSAAIPNRREAEGRAPGASRRRKLVAVATFPLDPSDNGFALRAVRVLERLRHEWSVTLIAPRPKANGHDLAETVDCDFVPVDLDHGWTYMPFQYDVRPFVDTVEREIKRHRPSVVLLWGGSEFLALEFGLPPTVVDRIDCFTLVAWRHLRLVKGWRACLSALNTALHCLVYERRVSKVGFATVVVGDDDRRCVRFLAGSRNVHVIPNGVELEAEGQLQPESDQPTVVFSGIMAYEPNIHAVQYFVAKVWPRIRAGVPNARMQIAGRHPTAEVRALENEEGVVVLGNVERMSDILSAAWVAVAPMRSGAGIKNKILEAWAAGTPVVMSSIATNGLRHLDIPPELVADDARRMADTIIRLLQDAEERRRLGRVGHSAARAMTWDRTASELSKLLRAAS